MIKIKTMDFLKIQVRATLKTPISPKINLISIDVSYPNSAGNYTWKSSGRQFDKSLNTFMKGTAKSGNVIDVVVPATWNDFENDSKEMVFDFVKNEGSDPIKIKQLVLYTDNKSEEKTFEIKDSEKHFETEYISFLLYEKTIGVD